MLVKCPSNKMKYGVIISVLIILSCILDNYNIYASIYDSDLGYTESEREHSGEYNYMFDSSGKVSASITVTYEGDEYETLTEGYEYILDKTYKCFGLYRKSEDYTYSIMFYIRVYNSLSYSSKNDCLREFKSTDFYLGLSSDEKVNVYNLILDNSDMSSSELIESTLGSIKPDLGKGYVLYKPFEGIVGIILGVFAMLFSFGLVATVVFDLVFFATENMHDMSTKPKFVSRIAYKVYIEAVKNNESVSKMLLKFGMYRILHILVFIYLLSYLTQNKLYTGLAKVLNLL